MKSRKGIISVIGNCNDCGMVFDDYITAQRKAYNHAKKTGHEVAIEVAKAIRYNPK